MTYTETVDLNAVIDRYGEDIADLRQAADETDASDEADEYEQAAQVLQNRINALEQWIDRYGGAEYELRVLTAQEMVELESTVQHLLRQEGTTRREAEGQRMLDAADYYLESTPADAPADPGDLPFALLQTLDEEASRLNMAGQTDFRAPGFGDGPEPALPGTSATPSASSPSSSATPPTDASGPPSGDS